MIQKRFSAARLGLAAKREDLGAIRAEMALAREEDAPALQRALSLGVLKAVEANHANVVAYLLDCGARLENTRDLKGCTVLSVATLKQLPDIQSLLLDRCDWNQKAKDNALLDAVSVDWVMGVRALLDKGANIHCVDTRHENARLSQTEARTTTRERVILHTMIRDGKSHYLTGRENYPDAPLMLAVLKGSAPIVKLLLDRGANVFSLTLEEQDKARELLSQA